MSKKSRNQTQTLFEIILQNVDYGIVVLDAKGNKIYENDIAGDIANKYLATKRKLSDREGKEIKEAKLPYNLARQDKQIHSITVEAETIGKEKEIWFHIRAVPVLNNRILEYIVVTWRDVTSRILEERKREHFIAIGSHELRTPLAGIKALNQVLGKLYYEKKYDKARSFFHKIDNKVNLLTKIIQDFIEVEKIRSGKLDFTPEFFDFDELVTITAQEMNTIYKSHKIEVSGQANAEIVADRERIYEVLTNLINNARKYSPDAKKIDVKVKSDKTKITIGVKDYGIGLSEAHMANIFEPFYRVKEPGVEKVHGLGLGLYISYKIVELHGGRMWVKSEIGKGSTFYFSIPKKIKRVKKSYEF